MASVTYINEAVDAVKSVLNTNVVALGNFTKISERDEDPAVLANSGEMPVFVVIPLADKPDRMRLTMGTSGEVYHDFSISIIGYYLYSNLDDDIRTLRGYGYTCFDLFRGSGDPHLGNAHVYSASLDVGYFVMVDYPIYRFILTLNVRMIEP